MRTYTLLPQRVLESEPWRIPRAARSGGTMSSPMPAKRRPIKKLPKGEQLIPLREDRRPWYHAPLRAAANGLEGLLGIFRRAKQRRIAKQPRAARRRRKK